MFVDDIWKATKRGDLEKVKEFVARNGLPKSEENYYGDQILTAACEAGHVEVVRYLLENGAYWAKYLDYSPQAFAALNNGHIEVLRVLLEFGLSPDVSRDKYSGTLFSTAVENMQREAALLLIEYGARIEQSWWGPESDEFGYEAYAEYDHSLSCDEDEEFDYSVYSVFEVAVLVGRPDMVEFFLDIGADLKGYSAEYYLERARENDVLRLEFERAEVERKIIEHQNQLFGDTQYGHSFIAKAIQAGIDPNRTDENGNNMLFRLLQQKEKLDEKSLEYLKKLAPLTDLSHTNNRGEHAWEVAKRRGEIKAMFYLMEYAKIPMSPEKKALFKRELRIRRILKFLSFLHSVALMIVLSPFIIFILLVWVIVSLILSVKDKILSCFKSNLSLS